MSDRYDDSDAQPAHPLSCSAMLGEDWQRLQGWLQAVITDPAGVKSGLASKAARQHLSITPDRLATVVEASAILGSGERLRIYSRSYHARLLECFQAEFPCLHQALGDEVFTQFVIEYLRQQPPHSYTLANLAQEFPDFLAATRPQAADDDAERETWPNFIIDLARLERAFTETYDGPGLENVERSKSSDKKEALAALQADDRQPPLSARQLATMPEEHLARLRLVAAPCLRLLAFRYPVLAYFQAARARENPPLPAPAATFVAVNRKDYIVRFYDLSAAQHRFLQALMNDKTVGEAWMETTALAALTPEPLAAKSRKWLVDWVNNGFFCDVAQTI